MNQDQRPQPLTEGHSISNGVGIKPIIPKPPVKPMGQGQSSVKNTNQP